MRSPLPVVLIVALLAACSSTPSDPARERQEQDLAVAEKRLAAEPDSEMAAVWVGRRLGYLGRYEDAVAAFTRGLDRHPDSAWLLRFRGHRYITLRQFDDAVRDLERARELAAGRPDEVEPDGQPNAAGIPIGTLRSNIAYHLGLALLLRGDTERAANVYLAALPLARTNDDRYVSHVFWTWIALRELGRHDEAARLLEPVSSSMKIHENEDYLAALLHFRGELSRDALMSGAEPGTTAFATRAHAAARKALYDGDREAARAWFAQIVFAGPMPAFSCIAAEVAVGDLETARAKAEHVVR
ncbi:MAG: tetratricopeptide repeat protein [Planctomycetota bacterium]|nr:tetratricopeptide repeat protein [Planctomycetota bacterium]